MILIHEAVKEALRQWSTLIEQNDFDTFFQLVQEDYTHRTTNNICNMFFHANIDFIPYMTFLPEGCFELSTLSEYPIPENIQRICFKCFSGSDLKQIYIPHNVVELQEQAFENCSFLKYVQVDEGCNVIGDSCFYSCDDLQHVILPSSLNSLGTTVFYDCDKLTSIQYNGTVQDWHKIKNAEHIADNASRLKQINCADGTIEL